MYRLALCYACDNNKCYWDWLCEKWNKMWLFIVFYEMTRLSCLTHTWRSPTQMGQSCSASCGCSAERGMRLSMAFTSGAKCGIHTGILWLSESWGVHKFTTHNSICSSNEPGRLNQWSQDFSGAYMTLQIFMLFVIFIQIHWLYNTSNCLMLTWVQPWAFMTSLDMKWHNRVMMFQYYWIDTQVVGMKLASQNLLAGLHFEMICSFLFSPSS